MLEGFIYRAEVDFQNIEQRRRAQELGNLNCRAELDLKSLVNLSYRAEVDLKSLVNLYYRGELHLKSLVNLIEQS